VTRCMPGYVLPHQKKIIFSMNYAAPHVAWICSYRTRCPASKSELSNPMSLGSRMGQLSTQGLSETFCLPGIIAA